MKPRQAVLGLSLAGAAALAAFGDKTPSAEVAEPVARAPGRAAPAARTQVKAGEGTAPAVLRLVSREALIGDSADAFGADENDPFARHDWTPPPPPPAPAPPPPAPSAPPLPFTYLGKSVGDGAWEVYLARGERIYLVREQTVIDGTWRVEAIAPPVMTLAYLPLNQIQQLNIGVFE